MNETTELTEDEKAALQDTESWRLADLAGKQTETRPRRKLTRDMIEG